jgi:hypothetical protein
VGNVFEKKRKKCSQGLRKPALCALSPMKNSQKNRYYVVRAIDCHGDSWPLASTIEGIDGIRHPSLASAQAVAAAFRAEKAFRKQMRLSNGWEANTIRELRVDEVTEH